MSSAVHVCRGPTANTRLIARFKKQNKAEQQDAVISGDLQNVTQRECLAGPCRGERNHRVPKSASRGENRAEKEQLRNREMSFDSRREQRNTNGADSEKYSQ